VQILGAAEAGSQGSARRHLLLLGLAVSRDSGATQRLLLALLLLIPALPSPFVHSRGHIHCTWALSFRRLHSTVPVQVTVRGIPALRGHTVLSSHQSPLHHTGILHYLNSLHPLQLSVVPCTPCFPCTPCNCQNPLPSLHALLELSSPAHYALPGPRRGSCSLCCSLGHGRCKSVANRRHTMETRR